jgi:hypothetical protein
MQNKAINNTLTFTFADGAGQYIGLTPITRASVAANGPLTSVFKVPFPTHGKIVAFEFYVGTANTQINFGLYRLTAPNVFLVISMVAYPSGFPLGFQRVSNLMSCCFFCVPHVFY